MKKLVYLFVCYCTLFSVSCSNEDFEPISPEDINTNIPDNTVTSPCDFDLSEIREGDTIIIDCILNLEGKKITLPANVTFTFNNGDIIDGTLDFPVGGKIDGRLLNSTLTLSGDVSLIDSSFQFYGIRWGIVEGNVTSDVALQNTAILENVIFYVKELGATTFIIDKLDAYFEVTKVTSTTTNQNFYPTIEAVNLPSDFNLVMTENTHLRIFPGEAGGRGGAILSVRDVSNVTITGGNLHGDRDQRQYSSTNNGLEGSLLLYVQSGKNIIIDSVHFEDGSAGALDIFSLGFSFNPDYNPTTGVIVKNCVFKNSRRMGLILTDGRDIVIEGNTFIDSGQPSVNSNGGEVGYAINIEPERYRDEDGAIQEYQRVFNVKIKGNTEYNSRNGFVTLTIGQGLIVEDNTIGTRVVYSFVSDSKIINNTFKAIGTASESWAIFGAGKGETVFNNEISGNSIEGYELGIAINSIDGNVHHNEINNCTAGIQLSKSFNVDVHDNNINVSGNGIQSTNTYIDEVRINNNNITSEGFHMYFAQLNNQQEYERHKIMIKENTFVNAKQIGFSNTNGVTFMDNQVVGNLLIGNAKNINISGNTIRPNRSNGIRLYGNHANVFVTDNMIVKPQGIDSFMCIDNQSDTLAGVMENRNTCN